MIEDILSLDSNLYRNIKSYQKKFEVMANYLLNQCILNIGDKEYQMAELEYYLEDGVHNDPFIHKDKHQSIPFSWYFHRLGGTYKGGTYKGLDITFGYKNNKNRVYGGILIRSIYDITNKTVIEGPCKVVNHILDKTNNKTIDCLIGDKDIIKINDSRLNIKYKKSDNLIAQSGPRVGLNLRKYTKEREEYLMKNYRFVNRIKLIKKYKSGIILSMYEKGLTLEEISNFTGTSRKNIDKYIDIFNNNKDIDAQSYNNKKALTVKNLCILQAICKKIEI